MENFKVKDLMVSIYPAGTILNNDCMGAPTGKCPVSMPDCMDGGPAPTKGTCPASAPDCMAGGPAPTKGTCPASAPDCMAGGPAPTKGTCPASTPDCMGAPSGKCPASAGEGIAFIKNDEELASLKKTLAIMQKENNIAA